MQHQSHGAFLSLNQIAWLSRRLQASSCGDAVVCVRNIIVKSNATVFPLHDDTSRSAGRSRERGSRCSRAPGIPARERSSETVSRSTEWLLGIGPDRWQVTACRQMYGSLRILCPPDHLSPATNSPYDNTFRSDLHDSHAVACGVVSEFRRCRVGSSELRMSRSIAWACSGSVNVFCNSLEGRRSDAQCGLSSWMQEEAMTCPPQVSCEGTHGR